MIERFAYCLLPCAYCLLAVWARAGGVNMGILSEQRGAEMCAKWVIFGGFGREKRGQKGVFWASEAGKRRFFAYRRGDWRAQGGFLAKIGHYVSSSARPKSTPRDDAKDETDARSGRSSCPYTLE